MSKGNEQVAVVTQGPWLGRDGFIAETAVRFDRAEAATSRLEREAEKAQRVLEELAEEVHLMQRFESFEHSLRNSRDTKIKEMEQGFQDLRARLDVIQGKKSTFVGLNYKTFETIDKKLAELSALQVRVEKSERNMRRCVVLFGAVFVVAVVAVGSHLF